MGTVFWTADIPFTFLSGYHAGGVVEMRPPKIAKAYLKSWFWVDILIVLLDWLLLFLASGVADLIGIMRISKTIRLTRILRLFRLLRVISCRDWQIQFLIMFIQKYCSQHSASCGPWL